jgi:pimeloyl-ACP methyl ester carboxylesterase
MDALGLPRASLAGNSLGGALAAVTAARHPQRVDRLVLLDAAGYNFALADRPPLLRLAARVPGPVLDALPQRPLLRRGLEQVYFDDALVTPEKVEEYLAPMARPGAQAAARRLLREGDGFGLPGVLRQVRAPTLVIWGAQDTWIPPRDADKFVRDIPGARKVVLDRCGHVPQEEKPAEVAALIADFLQGR